MPDLNILFLVGGFFEPIALHLEPIAQGHVGQLAILVLASLGFTVVYFWSFGLLLDGLKWLKRRLSRLRPARPKPIDSG